MKEKKNNDNQKERKKFDASKLIAPILSGRNVIFIWK